MKIIWKDGRLSPLAALKIIEHLEGSHLYYVVATQEVLTDIFPQVKAAPIDLLYGPNENPGKGNSLVQEIYNRSWANDGTIDVAEQKLAIQEASKAYVSDKEHFYVFKRAIYDYIAEHPEVRGG